MVLAPIVALARRPRGSESGGSVQHTLAAVAVTVALIGAFIVVGRLLPPGR
jgi:hypothetical protein